MVGWAASQQKYPGPGEIDLEVYRRHHGCRREGFRNSVTPWAEPGRRGQGKFEWGSRAICACGKEDAALKGGGYHLRGVPDGGFASTEDCRVCLARFVLGRKGMGFSRQTPAGAGTHRRALALQGEERGGIGNAARFAAALEGHQES
jgi:hypothetical protein